MANFRFIFLICTTDHGDTDEKKTKVRLLMISSIDKRTFRRWLLVLKMFLGFERLIFGFIGEKGRRIRKLTTVVRKRFKLAAESYAIMLLIMSGNLREFRAKSIKYKDRYMISSSQAVNGYINSAVGHVILDRACYAVLTSSWKVVPRVASAARAKSMKLKDGNMISFGQPVNEYIGSAVRHVLLRQVIVTAASAESVKFKDGYISSVLVVNIDSADAVTIHQPKDEENFISRP
ncbi:hypothetical protein C5167_021661 [Papaver somniferum]|nr:hypothetical protein C5167_021661 [Papaver somniferum]